MFLKKRKRDRMKYIYKEMKSCILMEKCMIRKEGIFRTDDTSIFFVLNETSFSLFLK